jgi:hypothetical protein
MKPLDVVATLSDLPEARLARGQVGTVVEQLDDEVLLVEFADLSGVATAIEPIAAAGLIALCHAPALAG